MKILALLSMSSCLIISTCLTKAQSLPACNTAQVTYQAAPSNLENRIQVAQVAHGSNPPASGTKARSILGTRWFVEADPNYAKAGSWTTTLYIGNSGIRRANLIASFKDHGNSFSAHWINEELLFIQVWWGHIASSDLILNVTTGHFIYDRLANYGQVVQPCTDK